MAKNDKMTEIEKVFFDSIITDTNNSVQKQEQEQEQEPPLARNNHGKRKRPKKNKGIIAGSFIIVGILICAWVIYTINPGGFFTKQDYPGPGFGTVVVTVKKGETQTQIANSLKSSGVIASVNAYLNACKENPNSNMVQPGDYNLLGQMRAADALRYLIDPKHMVPSTLTFPEGWTVNQIFQKISQNTNIQLVDLERLQKAVAKYPERVNLPKEAKGILEGWLFPDTYQIGKTDSATKIVKTMVENTIAKLNEAKIPVKKWNKTIILASMIEKESKIDGDRAKVARVFLNRIDADMPLQSDATVSYGSKSAGTVWTTPEQRNDKNGYNTYIKKGLPIGAICNPGLASITAAINPAKGKWLYFVVVNLKTGETDFNLTLQGHEKSVEKLKSWLEANPGYGK